MDDIYVVLKIKDKNIAFNVKDSQQKSMLLIIEELIMKLFIMIVLL